MTKEENELNEEDKKKLSINARAKNCLFCALSLDEFNQVSTIILLKKYGICLR